MLDDYGMYMTYGEAVNVDEMSRGSYLPEGLVEGCKLKRDIPKDAVLTYDDVNCRQTDWRTGCGPSSIATSAARPGWMIGSRSRPDESRSGVKTLREGEGLKMLTKSGRQE